MALKNILFLIPAIFSFVFLGANEIERQDIEGLGLVILTLNNGMRVCLKETPSKDELVFKLTASGGYSSVPQNRRASAELSSQIAIRSGVGNYKFDQLHALLYDRSLEFNTEVQPFSRTIEGTAIESESETFLKLINLFFTHHRFTEGSFRRVMKRAEDKIIHCNQRRQRNFEQAYMEMNLPNASYFKYLTVRDIKNASYQDSKAYFEEYFSNPSEFTCVIVGSFDKEKMVELVKKYLSFIPPQRESVHEKEKLPNLKRIKGVRAKVIANQNSHGESMSILTLPVTVELTSENYYKLDSIAKLVQSRLKKVLRDRFGDDSIVIDVSVESPLSPNLDCTWIKIQFVTLPKLASSMAQNILFELKRMQKDSVTKDEVEFMNKKLARESRSNQYDNYYWTSILSNYLTNGWDLSQLPFAIKPIEDKKNMNEGLQSAFSLDNYTLISFQI